MALKFLRKTITNDSRATKKDAEKLVRYVTKDRRPIYNASATKGVHMAYTVLDRARVVARFQECQSVQEVADNFGVNVSSIYAILKEAKVSFPKQRLRQSVRSLNK